MIVYIDNEKFSDNPKIVTGFQVAIKYAQDNDFNALELPMWEVLLDRITIK